MNREYYKSPYTESIEANPHMMKLVGDALGNSLVETVVLNMYRQIKNHPRLDEFLTKLESTGRTGMVLYKSFFKFNHFIADVYYHAREALPQNMAEGYLNAILGDDLTFEKWTVGLSLDKSAQVESSGDEGLDINSLDDTLKDL